MLSEKLMTEDHRQFGSAVISFYPGSLLFITALIIKHSLPYQGLKSWLLM